MQAYQPAEKKRLPHGEGYNDLVFETEFNRHERQGKSVNVAGTEPVRGG